MPALTLALLGSPQIIRADGGAVVFRSRKHLALLAYLAVEQRHSHSRDTLLGLLWPEAPEDAARSNLRVALADLRRLLGEMRRCVPAREPPQRAVRPRQRSRARRRSIQQPAGRVPRARARRAGQLRRLHSAASPGGRAVPRRFPGRLRAARQRRVRGVGADPARAAAPAGARGPRHAGRRLLSARATSPPCAGTPAASLSWSPGASRPTASSCAAWRSPATAVRRWRSTRTAGACWRPSWASSRRPRPPRSTSRSAAASSGWRRGAARAPSARTHPLRPTSAPRRSRA